MQQNIPLDIWKLVWEDSAEVGKSCNMCSQNNAVFVCFKQ